MIFHIILIIIRFVEIIEKINKMKKMLLILLCVPLIGSSQFILVKTQGSNLNVRQSPSTEANVIGKLENERNVNYSGEFIKDWIKINYYNYEYGDYGKTIEGWVNCNYLNAPNFSSEILSPINIDDGEISQHIMGDGTGYIENVDGIIIVEDRDVFVNINGKNIKLKRKKDNWDNSSIFNEYYANDLFIKMFVIPVSRGYAGGNSKGFLIINYQDKEELIFINYTQGS